MDPHLVGSLITILLVACIVAIVAERFKTPYTVALVLVGLVISFLNFSPQVFISYDVTFVVILPPLLFYAAMHINIRRLMENWRTILMLAIPGVVCSTFLIGFILHKVLDMVFLHALLFGALITPTDPISVISILKRVGAPERLKLILEGESLFNDGTGVVVFTIILSLVSHGGHFELGHTLVKFLTVAGGGVLVGIVLGFIACKFMEFVDDHLLEVAITVVLTFGAPLVAEFFHFSGVIAVVVAGLMVGNLGKVQAMSNKVKETIDNFWEVIDFVINSILFVVIGLELSVVRQSHPETLVFPILVGAIAVLISRSIVVYPVVKIKNIIAANEIPWSWSHVLFWGGLKGSISIALVVGLPKELPFREYFLVLAFGVVLLSLVVQGLAMQTVVVKNVEGK